MYLPPRYMDPKIRLVNGKLEMSSKRVIDTTEEGDTANSFSVPPKAPMMKALEVWKEMRLPDIDIPKRTKLILDS